MFFIAQFNQMDGFAEIHRMEFAGYIHSGSFMDDFWLELHLDQFKYINANHIWRGWLVDSCPFFCLKNSIHPTFLVHSQFFKAQMMNPKFMLTVYRNARFLYGQLAEQSCNFVPIWKFIHSKFIRISWITYKTYWTMICSAGKNNSVLLWFAAGKSEEIPGSSRYVKISAFW